MNFLPKNAPSKARAATLYLVKILLLAVVYHLAARLAATGIGLYKGLSDIKDWVRVKSIVTPQGDPGGKYEFNYQVFRDLYQSNKALMHRLVDRRVGD